MKILILSSEAQPYFKTGGLGDVAGALVRALRARGHDARLAMPRYGFLDGEAHDLTTVMPEIRVDVEGQSVAGSIETADGAAPTYFVRCDQYFDRSGAYGEVVAGQLRDYPDNIERFAFFSMACLWMLKGLDWRPDVIHCNDWQTALAPVYLRAHPVASADPFYRSIRVLFTIHNLAFQGRTTPAMLPRMGLGPDVFTIAGLEYHGTVNLLKGALVYSDHITTVSKRYAREIQTPQLGCGLEGVLRSRRDRLTGILNGIDETEWNPETDPLLPANYTPADLAGKATCKRALCAEFGLADEPSAPVLGMVARFSPQKGFELVDAALAPLVDRGARLALVGSGEPRYERMISRMTRKFPQRVGARMVFDNRLAHLVEAGADAFLMPSYYEPCGLNQMYSMRYGTPPIVRRTGGLADSVTDATPEAARRGRATGFVFDAYHPASFVEAMDRALRLYRESPDIWRRVMRAGMNRDFSWNSVASRYEALYRRLVEGQMARPAPKRKPKTKSRRRR